LEIEWQFYVLAPFAVFWLLRAPRAIRHVGLIALMVAGGWLYAQGHRADPRVALSLLHYVGFFAAGAWVAVLEAGRAADSCKSAGYDGLGLAAWVLTIAALLVGGAWLVAVPAATALIVLAGLRGVAFGRLLGWWPIYCIGGMCYTVYLYHFFIVSLVGTAFGAFVGWPATQDAATLAFGLVAIPVVVLVCIVPYLAIERPFMAWRPGMTRLADAFKATA